MKVGFELLAELVNIESTTGGEAAYLRYLEELFVGLGWQVERQEVAENRWNLWVRRSPSPRITFCTHVDTVPPHIPATLRGDTLHGRGACDTKGVLLAMVEAVLGLPDEVQQQCGFVWVVGEEVDIDGVLVLGPSNPAAAIPGTASDLYATNVRAFVRLIAPGAELAPDWDDEIVAGALIARGGAVVAGRVNERLADTGGAS